MLTKCVRKFVIEINALQYPFSMVLHAEMMVHNSCDKGNGHGEDGIKAHEILIKFEYSSDNRKCRMKINCIDSESLRLRSDKMFASLWVYATIIVATSIESACCCCYITVAVCCCIATWKHWWYNGWQWLRIIQKYTMLFQGLVYCIALFDLLDRSFADDSQTKGGWTTKEDKHFTSHFQERERLYPLVALRFETSGLKVSSTHCVPCNFKGFGCCTIMHNEKLFSFINETSILRRPRWFK